LLRKLKATVDEYATRVGQQAVVLCACPGRPNPLFKVQIIFLNFNSSEASMARLPD
jgi:hypothetical protein